MQKQVEIIALVDRETLGIKKGEILRMELEDDALVMLYHEQAKGLIQIISEK